MSSAHCRSSNLRSVGRSKRRSHPIDEVDDKRSAVGPAERRRLIAARQQLVAEIGERRRPCASSGRDRGGWPADCRRPAGARVAAVVAEPVRAGAALDGLDQAALADPGLAREQQRPTVAGRGPRDRLVGRPRGSRPGRRGSGTGPSRASPSCPQCRSASSDVIGRSTDDGASALRERGWPSRPRGRPGGAHHGGAPCNGDDSRSCSRRASRSRSWAWGWPSARTPSPTS